jgi:hypothetical protein
MRRTITLDAATYTADIGVLKNYRVAIRDGNIAVSPDLSARTADAEFEAVFYGRERIEIITAPTPETQEITATVPNPAYVDPETTPDVPEIIEETQIVTGPERYAIGPVELDADETPLVLAKRAKLGEIAAARYEAEVGGITVSSMTIKTDRESQALITGAALAATLDNTYTCRWKTEQGFVTLNAATVISVAQAVRAHVQACFDREAELAATIEAATTVEEVQAVEYGTI